MLLAVVMMQHIYEIEWWLLFPMKFHIMSSKVNIEGILVFSPSRVPSRTLCVGKLILPLVDSKETVVVMEMGSMIGWW